MADNSDQNQEVKHVNSSAESEQMASDDIGNTSDEGLEGEQQVYLITKNYPSRDNFIEGLTLIKVTKSSRDIIKNSSRESFKNKRIQELIVDTYNLKRAGSSGSTSSAALKPNIPTRKSSSRHLNGNGTESVEQEIDKSIIYDPNETNVVDSTTDIPSDCRCSQIENKTSLTSMSNAHDKFIYKTCCSCSLKSTGQKETSSSTSKNNDVKNIIAKECLENVAQCPSNNEIDNHIKDVQISREILNVSGKVKKGKQKVGLYITINNKTKSYDVPKRVKKDKKKGGLHITIDNIPRVAKADFKAKSKNTRKLKKGRQSENTEVISLILKTAALLAAAISIVLLATALVCVIHHSTVKTEVVYKFQQCHENKSFDRNFNGAYNRIFRVKEVLQAFSPNRKSADENSEQFTVYQDIELIERVFDNLISNKTK